MYCPECTYWYVAACIDCDGVVGAYINKTPCGGRRIKPLIAVVSADKQLCDELREVTGVGRIHIANRNKTSVVWRWEVTAMDECLILLKRIIDKLLLKKKQALLLQELLRLREYHRQFNDKARVTEEEFELAKKILELNSQRGKSR